MKTANLPSLRVDPELREAAESVLNKGESLSSFMEQSLRDEVNRRRNRAEFIARGLASRDEAKRTGEYFDADVVHAELRGMLVDAKAKAKNKGAA
ncbi:prevent-host-death protein [Pseudoxanthomonas sp. LH2527]|uniref:YlcI/YnfO family protein n=1 Tax=Pseudoxanthomonas sp. LH2527 TaxID=2923249 RepID=UPI001F12BF44|nr:YlcI/YnfO family protein [Pseudoxanthomonas sp. LH2527]MCH6483926.1 prevent-host-death protein [Pseudoxanthomonas sp. LH2527]